MNTASAANASGRSGRYGKVAQVMGPVVDVSFSEGEKLPEIFDALKVTNPAINDEPNNLTLEVSLHIGDNVVRCVAMDLTDGLTRGMPVLDTGAPVTVPVGAATLGRIIDVVGNPIDEMGPVKAETSWAIHRKAPKFEDQATKKELFE